jgi:hypothetical protein
VRIDLLIGRDQNADRMAIAANTEGEFLLRPCR